MASLSKESIEERLSNLEKVVLRFKASNKVSPANKDRPSKLSGGALDDKDYEEILRLGIEARDAETA